MIISLEAIGVIIPLMRYLSAGNSRVCNLCILISADTCTYFRYFWLRLFLQESVVACRMTNTTMQLILADC